MEGVEHLKSNTSKKPNSSKRVRVSSSGRVVKPPKKILTPLRKKSVCSKTLSTELERLKKLATHIQKKTEVKRNDTSEDTENRAVPDVRSRSRVGDDQLPSTLPISKHYFQDISHDTSSNIDLFSRTNTKSVSSTITAVSGTNKPMTEMNVNKLQSYYHNVELVPDSIQPIPLAANRTNSSENSASTIKITNEQNARNSELLKHNGARIEKNEQVESFSVTVSNQLKEMAECLKKIEEQNNKVEKQNKEILERLSQKNDGDVGLADYSLYEPLKGFPLSTVTEFKQLDNIDGEERRKQLYYHSLRLGGTKQREFLNCALKETMTDGLVCRFTWTKQKGTENFGDTKVSNILYQAAKDCPLFHGPENKTRFKGEMQEVMRATKQRYRNSTKKLVVDEPISDTEDEDEIHRRINVLEEKIAQQSHTSLDDEDLGPYDADIEAQI